MEYWNSFFTFTASVGWGVMFLTLIFIAMMFFLVLNELWKYIRDRNRREEAMVRYQMMLVERRPVTAPPAPNKK